MQADAAVADAAEDSWDVADAVGAYATSSLLPVADASVHSESCTPNNYQI